MRLIGRPRRKTMNLSDVEKGYIAGIIDGEGCFQIEKFPNCGNIALMIYNTNENLMKWLLIRLGGHVCKSLRDSPRKNMFMWRIRNKSAIAIIRELYPFLVVKRKQAEIALAAYEVICKQQATLIDSKGLSKEQRLERLSFNALMKQANA